MKAQLAALIKEVAVLKAQATTPVTTNRTVTPSPPSITGTTGHAVNSTGVACPTRMTKRGVMPFVNQQECSHCGKKDWHLPQDYFSLPQNASKKAEFTASRRTRKRKRAASDTTSDSTSTSKSPHSGREHASGAEDEAAILTNRIYTLVEKRPVLSSKTCLPAPSPRQVKEREQPAEGERLADTEMQSARSPTQPVRTPTCSPLKTLTNILEKVKAKYARRKARREVRSCCCN